MSYIQTNREWLKTLTTDELSQLFTDGLIVREIGSTDPGILVSAKISPFDHDKFTTWLNKPQEYTLVGWCDS